MRTLCALILLFGAALAAAAHAQPARLPITGLWLSRKQDVAVQLLPCADGTLCGRIAWLSPAAPQVGPHNQPLCGAAVLHGFVPDPAHPARPATDWTGGTVIVANKGETYDGKLHMVSSDTLELRAYLGTPLLGKTKIFTRVTARDYPDCAAITGTQ